MDLPTSPAMCSMPAPRRNSTQILRSGGPARRSPTNRLAAQTSSLTKAPSDRDVDVPLRPVLGRRLRHRTRVATPESSPNRHYGRVVCIWNTSGPSGSYTQRGSRMSIFKIADRIPAPIKRLARFEISLAAVCFSVPAFLIAFNSWEIEESISAYWNVVPPVFYYGLTAAAIMFMMRGVRRERSWYAFILGAALSGVVLLNTDNFQPWHNIFAFTFFAGGVLAIVYYSKVRGPIVSRNGCSVSSLSVSSPGAWVGSARSGPSGPRWPRCQPISSPTPSRTYDARPARATRTLATKLSRGTAHIAPPHPATQPARLR